MKNDLFRKGLVYAIVVLFVGVSIIPSFGTKIVEKSSTVSFDDNTLYVGGDGPGNYTRIQDAIDNATDGDTIRVYAGYYDPCYRDGLRIYKNLNIIGNGSKCTTIKGTVYVTSDRVIFKGFTVNGVYCSQGNNGTGVCFQAVCIILENSNHCIISNNTLSDGHAGIWLNHSNNNIIDNNNISNNTNTAIELHFSNDNVITRNIIRENRQLVPPPPFTYCVYINNFSNNNLIYHNNFINNRYYHAYDKGINIWDNGYPSCGNYWSDYTGIDNYSGLNQDILGSDDVGDAPYNISGGDNEDRYPLMEPYGMTKLTMNIGWGLLKFSGGIKNIGNKTAFNVQWKITIDGGFIIVGRHSSGTLPKPLLAGEETTVSSGIVLGFGRIMITVAVWADNAPLISESIPGFLFLFFIKINLGG